MYKYLFKFILSVQKYYSSQLINKEDMKKKTFSVVTFFMQVPQKLYTRKNFLKTFNFKINIENI